MEDTSLVFMPRRHACYSYPSYTPEVEGSLRKGCKRFTSLLKASLTALILLHQKGAITYELSYGQQPCLNNAIPPDKPNCVSAPTPPEPSYERSHLSHALSLASTSSSSHLETFNSDSSPFTSTPA